jgi:CheY-like chemotaxis protein
MTEFRPLVMIVEDDVFERMGASYLFSDAGYRVLQAGNAEEALRLFDLNADIRLLFTDINMPGAINGSGLVHHVAQRWPAVGIIVTSGRPRPEPLPRGTKFHAKPYEPIDVLQQAMEMTSPLG